MNEMFNNPDITAPDDAADRREDENGASLDPVYSVSKKNRTIPRMTEVLEQVIRMTQKTLRASAASILLFRGNDQELYFEAASGPVGKELRQVKLNTRYGIAGQVARTGKPLIVNDVVRSVNFHKMIDDTTGFRTKSLICAPLMVQRRILGVVEILNKLDGTEFGEADLDAVLSVANTAATAIDNTRQHQTILDAYKNTITTLAAAIDAKDPLTRGHSQRVMEYTLMAGTYLSLPAEEMETLEYAGVLHDIGKISIDSAILSKPEHLTPEDWDIMRLHPVTGANLLKEISFLEKASEIVLCHHERQDGKGYPNGIKGDDLPLGARIISVADAFDTMTTDRSYRQSISIEQALRELQKCSGSQFCPMAVKAFTEGLRMHTFTGPSEPAIAGPG